MPNALKILQYIIPLFFCPWNFPGKKTGVGCHFLLLTQGLNLSLLCLLQWQADSLHCARWEAHLLKKRSSLSSSQVLLLIASANNCQPFLVLSSKSLVSTLCEIFIYSSQKLFNLGTIFACLEMRVKVRLSICLRSQA